ncbi:MAG: hypothetical protein ACRDV4_01720 [Acidimicrobiales bacterium]
MPKPQDPRVPPEVEEYLVARNVKAGQIGGTIGGALGGGAPGMLGGRRGALRGADRGARRIHTTVEERTGALALTEDQVYEHVMSAVPKAEELPASGVQRWAVPVGVTGLVHVVVDIAITGEPGGQTVLRAFGKEGLITRHPTRQVADQVWSALES